MKKYLILGALAVVLLFVGASTTFAYTWTNHGGSSGVHSWSSVASDSTGMKLVAVDYAPGYIYTSTDGGVTWSNHGGSSGLHQWLKVTSDSTGMKIAAVDQYDPTPGGGYVYTSTDGGVTWSNHGGSSGVHSWGTITSNSNGMKLAAYTWGGSDYYIYTSTDGGVTWSNHGGSSGMHNWSDVVSDSTGMKLSASTSTFPVGCSYGGCGYVYSSTDGGLTWTDHGGSTVNSFWGPLASDSTGMKLVAASNMSTPSGPTNSYIYTSTDGGATWSNHGGSSGNRIWRDIASSSDGMKLIASDATSSGSYIYTSNNGGVTWTAEPSTVSGQMYVASDSSGTHLVAGGAGSTIFTTTTSFGTTPPTVTTNPATSITATSAIINGAITATGGVNATSEGFNYVPVGPAFPTPLPLGYSAPGVLSTPFISGSYGVSTFSAPVTGLTCGTLYHFQAQAANTAGAGYGADMTFTTLPCSTPFTITTLPATAITMTTADLNGVKSAGGALPGPTTITVGFEYGLTTAYGTTTPGTPMAYTGGTTPSLTFSGTTFPFACNTLYHYRAKAVTSFGTTYGADVTFTTLPCTIVVVVPTVITTLATSIGATSATLNGDITSLGGATSATDRGFNWSLSMTTPTTLDPFVSTTGAYGTGTYGIPVSGLTCGGTTYHYRAWATNSTGTSYGADMTFTTAPCPPVVPAVITMSATGITATGATLNGDLTSTGGGSTSRTFDWGTSTTYGTTPYGGSTTTTGAYNIWISGLTCNTTYHFRATATNSAGTATGVDMTFTTLVCPTTIVSPSVTTNAATSITATSAVINGTLTSLGGATSATASFEYGTSTSYGTIASFGTMVATGPFTVPLSGLTCNTTYHFRATATNSAGVTNGGDLPFTTLACPIIVVVPNVITTAATSVGITSATINGNLTSLGGAASVAVGFQYGTTTSYGATPSAGTLTATGPFSKNLTGLACNTTYHYFATAVNSAGTDNGLDMTFTTLACPITVVPPSVTTVSAIAVTTTTATLNGNLTGLGGATSATTSFEYGASTSYGTTATFGPMGAIGPFSKNIASLTCGTLYHFRAKAVNSAGTTNGADMTFTTSACPVVPVAPSVTTNAATAITATTATINGTVTSTGGATVTSTGFTGSFGPTVSTPASITTVPTSFSRNLTGLACGTNYTFRATATSGAGATSGSMLNFTTTSCPPTVATTSGSLISQYIPPSALGPAVPGSAKLVGNLLSFGLGNTSASVGFEWGPTTAYGTSGVVSSSGSSLGSYNMNIPLYSLVSCNEPWHFRATATNAGGIATGVDMTFCN